MQYTTITCQSAIHTIRKSAKPYHLDLNIYRGCEHKCQYCFAMYSHRYLNTQNYFSEIFIKANAAEVLDKELSKRKKQEVLNIGGVCDSYQPIEKETKLMRQVLQVCIKHKTPIIISTKSDLILRDIDLIQQLAEVTAVNIAATITFMDDNKRSIVEPNAVSCKRRFAMLERIKKETKAIVGVHLMPIIPYLNDDLENLETIYQNAQAIQADYILPGTLYLRGHTRDIFFKMMDTHFPHLKGKLYHLYTNGDKKAYKQLLYANIQTLKTKYHANHNYQKPLRERLKTNTYEQLTLF